MCVCVCVCNLNCVCVVSKNICAPMETNGNFEEIIVETIVTDVLCVLKKTA